MKIFYDLSELEPWEKPVVTLGTFDGVHLGHQAILRELSKSKNERKRHSLLVTYEPHPQMVVSPENSPLLLSTLEEKLQLLQNNPEGRELSGVLIMKFDKKLSQLTAGEFLQEVVVKTLKAGELITGENHAFGKERSGGIELLKKASRVFGFELKVVPSILQDNTRISSSRIRKEMQNGDFDKGCRMLGHSYLVSGKPVKGKGIGAEIGYPTINLEVPEKKLLPKKGVYGSEVEMANRKYYGMMYIGRKLTLDEESLSLEINLFDYQGDKVPDKVMVNLHTWIRGEMKFENLKGLQSQLSEDEKKIRQLLIK
ncbi:MAG TPA: bifunctional riboflavin kinase/FAD synthetase [Terriglobales bacterium]|nr:bifunctional riboflavin kinase/FAD synthetase [Terriglobales bacterium]